jgi:quercetin dioxygenase-like cupin family protein
MPRFERARHTTIVRPCVHALAVGISLVTPAVARTQGAPLRRDATPTLNHTPIMTVVGTGTARHAQPPGTKRTDLQRHDLSAPGREVIQVRVDFDPGYVAPRHTHPGEEIIYVLEGTLEYRIEGQPPATVKAGDVLFVPAGTIHAVTNVGSGHGAELATYVVEKGKPLITLVR